MVNNPKVKSINNEILNISQVIQLKEELASFNITFKDLVTNCPINEYTQETLLDLACTLAKDDIITSKLNDKKFLDISLICLRYGYKKKFIKKWKVYIIALVLILQQDKYSLIKSFLRNLAEDYDE